MIESISISDIATYAIAPEVLNGLAQFNYLFGSNGTGKTTVSRVIADANSFPTCTVTWKAEQNCSRWFTTTILWSGTSLNRRS